MVRTSKKLPASTYREMKRGIYAILLGARDEKGMGGGKVTEELRRGLDSSIIEYYERSAQDSKGSRSLKGYVDDILSGMRTNVCFSDLCSGFYSFRYANVKNRGIYRTTTN